MGDGGNPAVAPTGLPHAEARVIPFCCQGRGAWPQYVFWLDLGFGRLENRLTAGEQDDPKRCSAAEVEECFDG